MGVFTDTWTPNTANTYSRNVGFNPKALEIDNFSAFYLFVPDAGKYIAPNTVGVIVPISHYSGQVTVQAVTGNSAYPVTDTGNLNSAVTITATQDDLSYQVGQAFNSTIVNAVVISGTVAISGNVGITGPVTVNGSVSISGTPAVTISGTPTVNIGGTVNANITAGTVNVQNVTNGILTSAGAIRYLGHHSMGSQATYTITAQERALIIFNPQSPNIALTVQGVTSGVYAAIAVAVGSGSVFIAYVNPSLDTQWNVNFGGAPGTSQGFVCADTGLPLTDLPRIGPQAASASYPVTLNSETFAPPGDQATGSIIAVTNLALSSGAAGSWDRMRMGQQVALHSLGVVPASDYAMPLAPGLEVTYSADTNGAIQVPTATSRLWACIFGNGSKTMKLKRFRISQYAAATAPGMLMLGLYHWTVAPTGGTAMGKTVMQSGDTASVSTNTLVNNAVYTSDGTSGTRFALLTVPVVSTYPGASPIEYNFGQNPGGKQPTIPSGTTEGWGLIYIGLVGVTGSPTFAFELEYSES